MVEPPEPAPAAVYVLVALTLALLLTVILTACSATDSRLWPHHYGWTQPVIQMEGQAQIVPGQA